ncbi:hypothetical protein GGF46_003378 [Coemansia sp. RSA 552]|nr:hypothetical protein GGF46_003378 [Coemansia sp. RSA 552]
MFVGSSVGLFTGVLSMALQGRLVMKPRLSYGVYMVLGAGLGWQVDQMKQHQKQTMEKRRLQLIAQRDERRAAAAAAAATEE